MRGRPLPMALLASLTATMALAQAPADSLRLPRLFGEGMVVQRGSPVAVWGWAAPGSAVAVRFAGRRASATADAAGRWRTTLPAMPAGRGPPAPAGRGGRGRARC